MDCRMRSVCWHAERRASAEWEWSALWAFFVQIADRRFRANAECTFWAECLMKMWRRSLNAQWQFCAQCPTRIWSGLSGEDIESGLWQEYRDEGNRMSILCGLPIEDYVWTAGRGPCAGCPMRIVCGCPHEGFVRTVARILCGLPDEDVLCTAG